MSIGKSSTTSQNTSNNSSSGMSGTKKGHHRPPPASLEVVYKVIETEANYFHKTVEDIYAKYSLADNSKKLQFESLSGLVNKIFDSYSINPSKIQTWSDFEVVCQQHPIEKTFKTDPEYKTLIYIGKIIHEFGKLYVHVNRRLNLAFGDHLLRYCVSLADIPLTSIDFVNDYENFILKNRPEIIAEIQDLKTTYTDWCDFTRDLLFAIDHGEDVMECIAKARASINKLFYYAIEWVEEDRRYTDRIKSELSDCTYERDTYRKKLETLQQVTKSNQAALVNIQSQLLFDQRIALRLRQKMHRCHTSQELLRQRIDMIKIDHGLYLQELELALQRLCRLEAKRLKRNKRKNSASRICLELKWADSDKEICEIQMTRVNNNFKAMKRHTERLMKLESRLHLFISEKDEHVTQKQEEVESHRILISDRKQQIEQLKIDLSFLDETLNDLKILNEKKKSTSSLRELHNFGHVFRVRKSNTPMETVCHMISQQIGAQWKELYLVLPMKPERPVDKRRSDVDVIDSLAAKHDETLQEQAASSLKKWRLFYHRAEPAHLVAGLKKIKRLDLAIKVNPGQVNQ